MNSDFRLVWPTTPGSNFDDLVLPHPEAGRRLARWLIRNEHDAEDAVQEASLRAFRYFRTFVGGDSRVWFLGIVRNICLDWRDQHTAALTDLFDDEKPPANRHPAIDPEALLLRNDDSTLIARAMRSLPDRFHHLLVLRELGGLSYRELADVTGIPIGTVMSRLSRARERLRGAVYHELEPTRSSAGPHIREQEADAVLV